MPDFDKIKLALKSYSKQYKTVISDFEAMLDALKDEDIPNREKIIDDIYSAKLDEFKMGTARNILKGSTKNGEPETKKKIIYSLIDEIKKTPESRKDNLDKILNLFDGISESDKQVLRHDLMKTDVGDLKTSIQDIMDAFEIE